MKDFEKLYTANDFDKGRIAALASLCVQFEQRVNTFLTHDKNGHNVEAWADAHEFVCEEFMRVVDNTLQTHNIVADDKLAYLAFALIGADK